MNLAKAKAPKEIQFLKIVPPQTHESTQIETT